MGQESLIRSFREAASAPAVIRSFLSRIPTRQFQFIKFCFVGSTGTLIDMAVLCLLADPRCLGLNITLSKIVAAEVALISNFIGNELWTFGCAFRPARQSHVGTNHARGVFGRFLLFNCICGMGISFAVLLLHLFHTALGWNLYLSNALAIFIVTLWNFGMNARFNWRGKEGA